MDKVEKIRAIDATRAKLDDLFDPESSEDDRQNFLEEFSPLILKIEYPLRISSGQQ